MKKPQVAPDEIYTVEDTCSQLGIDRRTLRRWTAEGSIQSRIRRADKRIVYTGKDIISCYTTLI